VALLPSAQRFNTDMKLSFVLAAAVVACASPEPLRPPPVTNFRSLLDSLAAEGSCAGAPLVQASPPALSLQTVVSLSPSDMCALTSAAMRRLAREAPNEPIWAPGDTARVVTVTVSGRVITQVDSTFAPIAAPDTVARVELDIDGRARLVWFHYGLGAQRETMGAVHRGPCGPSCR